MKKIFLLLLIITLTLCLFISCAPTTPSEGEGEGEPEDSSPGSTTNRVVLVELFNAVGCGASKAINPIMEELAQEYGTDQVILVEEAGWGKYSTPETMERFSWYVTGTKHTPFIAINGLNETLASVGAVGGGGGGGGGSSEPTEPPEEGDDVTYEETFFVQADLGGVFQLEDGSEIIIEPNDLSGDTEITIRKLDYTLDRNTQAKLIIPVLTSTKYIYEILMQPIVSILNPFDMNIILTDKVVYSETGQPAGIYYTDEYYQPIEVEMFFELGDWSIEGEIEKIKVSITEIGAFLFLKSYSPYSPYSAIANYQEAMRTAEMLNEILSAYLNAKGLYDQNDCEALGNLYQEATQEYWIAVDELEENPGVTKEDAEEIFSQFKTYRFWFDFIIGQLNPIYGIYSAFITTGEVCKYLNAYINAVEQFEICMAKHFKMEIIDYYYYMSCFGEYNEEPTDEIMGEIGAWTITGYDPYCIREYDIENIEDRAIFVYWPLISDADYYKVYRMENNSGTYHEIYSGNGIDYFADNENRGWFDFNVVPGNYYAYWVSFVKETIESDPSKAVMRRIWLPECSLASPPNYNPDNPYDQPVTEPEPLLEWNPVGVSSYPYQGDIQSGKSEIWVVAYNTPYPVSGQGEGIWAESFDDLTTSATRFDPNAASRPLVPGSDHIYAWESKGIGYDHNEDIIAVSWSGARHFFYMEPPEIIEPPVTLINIEAITFNNSYSDTSKARDTFNRKQSDNRTAVKFLDDNTGLIRGDSIYHYIGPWWEVYPEAEGYRIYRKINDSNYELIYDWDVSDPEYNDAVTFRYSCVLNPEIGDTFSFYVVAYNNSENWETVTGIPLEKTIDNETFLPPIYLNQPQEYGNVNNSNYLFQWTPVGVILPYGDIIEGYTHIIVFDDDYMYYWYGSFNNFTTSQAAYNGDTLVPGNTYNWRVTSYGFDAAGIESIASSRSQVWKFTYTGTSVEPPTVTTLEAYTITKTAATLWGEIVSTGGLTVTRRGFEYKDSAGGSTFDWHEDGDWSANDYIYRITNLLAGHTYLYRAYAVNDQGTGYGAWESFKTTEEIITSPSVTTVGADNIQETSIRFKGRIDDTGGEDADWRGFRIEDTVTGWIYSPRQESGPYGTGDYYITYITLSPGHTYKYKACAHNSVGTSYGTEKTVTTQASKQLVSIESSISSVSLRWPQMLMDNEYDITAHYSDGSSADIWHINCTWSSSKPDIVNVNDGGMITPLVKTADFAVVTMEYTEGGITKSDTIAVTVLPYP